MMAEAVDLTLFEGRDSLVYNDESQAIYFEPECATVGENWDILSDAQASNGNYVMVKPGIQSLSAPPTGSESVILIPFSVDTVGNYSVFARLDCPTADDDSYWVKMGDGMFQLNHGLGTSGWEWKKFNDNALAKGEHTLTIAYREDGAKLDKICISNSHFAPLGMGKEAENVCSSTRVGHAMEAPDAYALEQNYPNPFNPRTVIRFRLSVTSHAELAIYSTTRQLVRKLVNRRMAAGIHSIVWDTTDDSGAPVASGLYLYKLRAGTFTQIRKMSLLR